ncbi:protein O-linked-mannose beta-1,2-N-acetylglucosaminyltransferase 1-like isoform X2 [Penaeus japonicus]|uniref:protein O-linked-mannose beta-1,2-N-acetylglucosaminyltransferase 1-like isoform X2 n=1 Tax=Penaeus japonicus TaxID=27405 RepID=UPI001C7127F2|nr:protein O-linked-mannose beta-1,2-N-acetylglucosaminyltransferase 1-like isoform X2 [Penaeus japonicus]
MTSSRGRSLVLVMGVLVALATPTLPAHEGDERAWAYLARYDPELRPMRASLVSAQQTGDDGGFEIAVRINTSKLEVAVDGRVIYEGVGGTGSSASKRPHSGVHVIVMHPCEGHVMRAQKFLTSQPAEHVNLAHLIASLQPGRIVIVAAVPEWFVFLGEEGEKALAELGFAFPSRVASGEPWLGVAVAGRRVIAEGIATGQPGFRAAGGLNLAVRVPKVCEEGRRCDWYAEKGRQIQAEFCERYEGYGDLCSCHDPFTADVRSKQAKLKNRGEHIPVVVVTANKPRHLFRLLRNLFTVAGASETGVVIVVDGALAEPLALGAVLGVDVVVHTPTGTRNERTNANIRFALYTVFKQFPDADKAIVLEDDLLLAPDALSFFHQSAWLLDRDPTLFCVNGFNSNSLPGMALDPSKMLRSESFPMYGWMVRRRYARQVVMRWIPYGVGDWDYWLMHADQQRGRDVASPEVSRIYHAGSTGVHVDGFEQHLFFGRMVTTTSPEVRLENLTSILLDNYMRNLTDEIKSAEMLTPNPLEDNLVPESHPGPFVVFVKAGTRNDEFFSFRIFMMTLNTYYWDTREIFRGVMRFRVQGGRLLYVVGCPLAQDFCKYNPKGYMTLTPSKQLIAEVQRYVDQFEQSFYGSRYRQRALVSDPAKEAQLLNFV